MRSATPSDATSLSLIIGSVKKNFFHRPAAPTRPWVGAGLAYFKNKSTIKSPMHLMSNQTSDGVAFIFTPPFGCGLTRTHFNRFFRASQAFSASFFIFFFFFSYFFLSAFAVFA